MHFLNAVASLISVLSLTKYAEATLRITADHHSFGGVNYPGLQFLVPEERNEVIKAMVKANARVIRLFVSGDKDHPDPEKELGELDYSDLDIIDDTLAAIHRIGKGDIKVIIAPHDSHALRGSNDVPCDVYCKMIGEAFLDFYSNTIIRDVYKNRLTELFNNYRSKNFDGRSWSTLNEVIMGVDLQNEPWGGIWPIVAGEPWLCDIAEHLKDVTGLGENGIAVITGGVSGANSAGRQENFPDSALNCKAVDVIGVHGYFSAHEEQTAGTPWANMFLPGNTLTSRALEKSKKLILVEELSYVKSINGIHYKKADIWDQGNALNYRGIPWMYSKVTTQGEGSSGNVNILWNERFAVGALKDALKRASTSRSNFNWSKFLPAPKGGLSNATHVAMNPFTLEQAECTFGCLGWLCDAPDGCKSGYTCKNSVCQQSSITPGSPGASCDNKKKFCQAHLKCINGECAECIERKTKVPPPRAGADTNRAMWKRPDPIPPPGHIQASCDLDDPFRTKPYCILPSSSDRRNPCERAAHCNADEYCDWGICAECTEGCLGHPCKASRSCKTGFCNSFGRCDYPQKIKKPMQAYGFSGRKSPGMYHGNVERGPSKPRDNTMRVNIPKEEVVDTAKATATAHVKDEL